MTSLGESLSFHGFTRIEARVYLKLLEMNRSKVSDLGKIAGITRTQLYPLLENMVEKGYIRQVGTKPVSYEALEPRDLTRVLRERRKRQIEELTELESKLDKITPVQKIPGTPYKIYLIREKSNILRKTIELWQSARKEVVMTTTFENDPLSRSKKLAGIRKEKARKGVKTTVYLSIKPENLYRIGELENFFKDANFGGLVKEKPYTTVVFDRKCVLTIFYNFHKREYDSAFYFENPDLAETFASKGTAPVESYPLKGEVRLTTIGGERALLIPPVIDLISKKEQYKLGYGVGWYGIKSFKKHEHSLKTLMMMLETQMMINGWGKVKVTHKGDAAVFVLENAVVPAEFVKGNIEGFLSVMGDYAVKEKAIKKNRYEFVIKAK